jgi:hypothetical protein
VRDGGPQRREERTTLEARESEVGLIRFGGQWDYAADLTRVALSNSAELT